MIRYSEMKNYVSVFSRDEVRNLNRIDRKRTTIILPENFYNATLKMCWNESRENSGALIVAPAGKILNVQAVIPTGYGSQGYVTPNSRNVTAVNILASQNSGIGLIDFHTHPKRLGEAWNNRFSDFGENSGKGDFLAFFRYVNINANYRHVLFTASHILTWGLDRPQFLVADFEKLGLNPMAEQHKWNTKFHNVLNSL